MINLSQLKQLFSDNGCLKIYVKSLSPNDNSKNQVYFGGSFEILNILPISKIVTEPAGNWEKERFKAALNFGWLSDEGNIHPAPHAQLILYPKYPEVRFSGFLNKCADAPSELMTQRLAERLLFLGVSQTGMVLGYVVAPGSDIAKEFQLIDNLEDYGLFKAISLKGAQNNREKLLNELWRIHQSGWITSKRLDRFGNILPCDSPNCGGYTLEAELGITPNGYSEPDFLGWEVKQFGVPSFNKISSTVITLMTPEPTHGYYVEFGTEAFVRKYGYTDKKGKADRMNFGGVHKAGIIHSQTNLRLELVGFDSSSGKIRNTSGKIALIDQDDNEAASWSFSSMLLHWNRKHNQACYVPSMSDITAIRKYQYGNKIILGTGTDFQLFLKQMDIGNIYYDPGIKVENMSTKPKAKRRSQFRIKSGHLNNLYHKSEIITLQ